MCNAPKTYNYVSLEMTHVGKPACRFVPACRFDRNVGALI
jgi:hypothetical protein